MKSEFNEFTYAYAVTEDIVHYLRPSLSAAPFIPTLNEEGRVGGGYDLRLNLPGYALFFQYKIADYIGRRGKLWQDFGHNYYRFKIWKTAKSDQHALMRQLEDNGEFVWYVAPIFARNRELNEHYQARFVSKKSIFVPPSAIGDLPDNREHHWAYNGAGLQFFCSDLIKKTDQTDRDSWIEKLPRLTDNSNISTLEANLEKSLQNLQATAQKLVANQPLPVRVETIARSLGCGTVIVATATEANRQE
jgi:hypothetical protein